MKYNYKLKGENTSKKGEKNRIMCNCLIHIIRKYYFIVLIYKLFFNLFCQSLG